VNELTQPCKFCRQMSGSAPDGSNILSVLLKLTYMIDDGGRLQPAPEQLPLVVSVRADERNPKILDADTDLYPFKVAADVVVTGHAYGYESRRRFNAVVRVGTASKSIAVIGDRRCALGREGRVVISDPLPVQTIPLRYDRAYGGRDAVASAKYGNVYDELRKYLSEPLKQLDLNVYDYPRNPAGRGFVVEVTREALESVQLPNFEDPQDLLTAEHLAAGTIGSWPRMPLPQGLSWVDPSWFPRVAYFGMVPKHDRVAEPIAEVQRGFAPADVLDDKPVDEKFDFRCANGASLGLQFPHLVGNEEIELRHLHPTKPLWKFQLPGVCPKLWTDGRKGKLNVTVPVVHTVLVEPDRDRVSIVWRGSAQALRPYMDDELATMPLRAEF
jgi:hypothetical protein